MNGVEYYRRVRQYTRSRLATLSGVNLAAVDRICNGPNVESMTIDHARSLAKALDVTVDELLMDYPEAASPQKKMLSFKENKHPCNSLENYRRAKHYTYLELAQLLNISKQAARFHCTYDKASRKTVQKLARYENMTEEAFEEQYGKPMADVS